MRRLAVVAACLLVVGCGGESDGEDAARTAVTTPKPVPGSATGPGAVRVRIVEGRFVPDRVEAKVGQVIVWVNDDRRTHTVTARTAPHFASGRLRPRATFTYTVSAPGKIEYVSRSSPSMRGHISVED